MTTTYTLLSAPDSSLQQDAISILQIFDFKNIPYTLEKTSSYWIWDCALGCFSLEFETHLPYEDLYNITFEQASQVRILDVENSIFMSQKKWLQLEKLWIEIIQQLFQTNQCNFILCLDEQPVIKRVNMQTRMHENYAKYMNSNFPWNFKVQKLY